MSLNDLMAAVVTAGDVKKIRSLMREFFPTPTPTPTPSPRENFRPDGVDFLEILADPPRDEDIRGGLRLL